MDTNLLDTLGHIFIIRIMDHMMTTVVQVSNWTRVSHSLESMTVSGGLNWGLILVQMRKWVLGKVLMSIVVCINGLRLKMCNGIKLLDNHSTETGQGSETVSNSMRSSCIKAWILCINDSFFPVAGWPASLSFSSHLVHCQLVLLLRHPSPAPT